MRLDQLALDMATQLLADPHDEMVTVWRRRDEWGWSRTGGEVPDGAEVVIQDRVQNADTDATTEPAAINSYASELAQWLHAEQGR